MTISTTNPKAIDLLEEVKACRALIHGHRHVGLQAKLSELDSRLQRLERQLSTKALVELVQYDTAHSHV